jgi:hypothetical protein
MLFVIDFVIFGYWRMNFKSPTKEIFGGGVLIDSCLKFTLTYFLGLCFILTVLGPFAKRRKASESIVISVFPSAWNNSASTGQIFLEFDASEFFENLSRKFKFD